MVRAGVVKHPSEWECCEYHELKNPPHRYRIIDRSSLFDLFEMKNEQIFQQHYAFRIKEGLKRKEDEKHLSRSIAIGSRDFVKQIMNKSGIAFNNRNKSYQTKTIEMSVLKEETARYGK